MRFTHLKLENWRNFLAVDVALDRRVFIVGANAAGKSNFLDAFRFLRDIADPQGGFQRAVTDKRGSVSKIRSLHARRYPNVAIEVEMDLGGEPWTYRVEFTQDNQRQPVIKKEIVRHGGEVVLSRPDDDDEADPNRLTQTHLEQVNANKKFRQVASFLGQVRYLHLVPQLVRDPERSAGRVRDPYGGDFLAQLAHMKRSNQRQFESRLRKIKDALKVAVPQLKDLVLEPDERGVPHLKGLYEHWRPNAGWQLEDQFSDGTLRLLGLLWALLDGTAPLLLEEPELSLHAEVVRRIPSMMERVGRKTERQTIVSTHSFEMLDETIGTESVLWLVPSREGTSVVQARDDEQIRSLVEGGMPVGEAVLPRSAPPDASQLSLFDPA
jgi:predicted ATPase